VSSTIYPVRRAHGGAGRRWLIGGGAALVLGAAAVVAVVAQPPAAVPVAPPVVAPPVPTVAPIEGYAVEGPQGYEWRGKSAMDGYTIVEGPFGYEVIGRDAASVPAVDGLVAVPRPPAAANPPAAWTGDQAIGRLRVLLAGRGFGADVTAGPMVAYPPGNAWPLDFTTDGELEAVLSSGLQAEAWLIETNAGRWWLWDYGATAPADRRAQAHEDVARALARAEGRAAD